MQSWLKKGLLPQVLVCSHYDTDIVVKSYLKQIDDWTPLQIHAFDEKTGNAPHFIRSYKKLIKTAFREFASILNEPEIPMKDISLPIEFDLGSDKQ